MRPNLTELQPVWSREREIIELAEAVAAEYCPTGRFDLVPILKDNTVTISFGHYREAFDGMLEHYRSRFHIYCNLDRVEREDAPRARFTIGHELGHFFIDEHRNALSSGRAPAHPSVCEYESDLLVEREADTFSSHLLMPTSAFNGLALRNERGLAGILRLTQHFGTSITSTAIRYAKAEIVPCTLVKWGRNGLEWRWFSAETFRVRLRRTTDDTRKLPEDCPTRRVLSGETPPRAGFFEAGTTADSWFPFLGQFDSRNVVLVEQAIPLGRFGVLTFLYPHEGSYGRS